MRPLIFIIFLTSSFSVFSQSVSYDWLLIYYMPYDNDLSPWTATLKNQFLKTKINSKSCVVLQTDVAGPGGMMRYTISSTIDSLQIESESSASIAEFHAYLTWVTKNFKARHYAIILMNHGGLLNEYGLDEFPERQWMRIDDVAREIEEFNEKAGISAVDLLFEQVCARSTIENLYEFKDASKFTLASQNRLPAPNYYYPAVFSAIDDKKIKSGPDLADLIVKSERADMYYSYSLIDNSKWKQWISLFDNYVAKINSKDIIIQGNGLKFLSYSGGLYFDFGGLIVSSILRDKIPREGDDLRLFNANSLVSKLYINPTDRLMIGYSGISIFSPFREDEKVLSIYKLSSFNVWLKELKTFRRKDPGPLK